MTGTSSSRTTQVALGLIALGAFLLRVFPFFGADGAWSYRVDYDEGVYFSSASLLLDGVLPYRDYVFVHPPGLLVFLSLTSWVRSFLGVDGAFALSRWIAALLGAINVVLVGKLVLRSPHARFAALIAAALYATYPELVQVERGPFLEPLLNLVCLSLATAVVIASESPHRARWLWFAGALAGFAVSIKLWAAVWVVAALWAILRFATKKELLEFVFAAALSAGLVVLPFALQAPENFVTQAGLFHAWRPPDGMTGRVARFGQFFALRHLASPVLASLMLGVLLVRRELTAASRVIAAAWVLTFAAFLASPSYWSQYNAHLIASEAVLAGLFLSWATPHLVQRTRLRVVLGALLATALAISLFHSVKRSAGDERHLQLARSSLKTSADCVFTFEPGWSLAAGRLPPQLPATPLIVDSYAQQLLTAVSGGQRFASSIEAFGANQTPLAVIDECRFVVLGDRGRRQLSPTLLDRLNTTHAPVELHGMEVWQRRPVAR
jgi:hypothetical protein